MKTQLLIPSKIKVGFNKREDTYTKKLAYVIYYDSKGVLRKETSWEGWRDKKIDAEEYDNVPTEGFVLNKKAGGYSSGWNQRQTYCRVFDPRGFEFEITIPNLLFILQETSSFQGKGLEGEFVYSWEGKDIVLLPVCSVDYKSSKGFTDLQAQKVSAKTLIPGCSYKTKRQEDLIYLGKFNWHSFESPKNGSWREKITQCKKVFVFVNNNGDFLPCTSVSNLAVQNSDVPVNNFAELMEKFSKTRFASPVVSLEIVDEQPDLSNEKYYGVEAYKKVSDEEYVEYDIDTERRNYNYQTGKYEIAGYKYREAYKVTFKNGVLEKKEVEQPRQSYNYSWNRPSEPIYKKEQIIEMGFQMLYAVLESGEKFKLNQL